MTHVYITLHNDLFLPQQLPAIRKHVPGAVIHLVATRNASATVREMADISLPHLATWPLFHGLAARVAPGPGMVMEWDMVPVAPVRIRRAVNVEPGHGPYPSLAMWGDSEDLRGGRFDGWEHLEQPYLEDGCGQQNHFRLVDGSILHFHHWAAGRRPFGLSQERLACWDSLLGGRQSGGPGTELKALLSRLGISASPGCKCDRRARLMDLRGCDWCDANAGQIERWLAEEAARRGLPYARAAGMALMRAAVRRARKKGIS